MYERKRGALELAFSACFLIDRGRHKNKPAFYRKIFKSLLRDTFSMLVERPILRLLGRKIQ